MRNGTPALGPVAVISGVLVGAVLILGPARSDPTPGPVAEIVIGESADGPTAVVETPPTVTPAPGVVEPPAPLVGDDLDGDGLDGDGDGDGDGLGGDDLDDDGPGADDD